MYYPKGKFLNELANNLICVGSDQKKIFSTFNLLRTKFDSKLS